MPSELRHGFIPLKKAAVFVGAVHRHARGAKGYFALGAWTGETLVGVVVVGQPKARKLNAEGRAEVTRLATDGTPHACSFLYAAARRVWQAMGGTSLKTYTLVTEPGTSLRALGIEKPEHTTKPQKWDRPSRPRKNALPTDNIAKHRWELIPQPKAAA